MRLGIRYQKGHGVEKDLDIAFFWIEHAAHRGLPKAEYYLGLFYYYGEGAEEDDESAIYWFKRAGNHGNDEAHYWLAKMYIHGYGVSKDLEKARYHLEEAEESSDAVVLQKIADLLSDESNKDFYDLDRALSIFTRALENEAENPKYWHKLGLLLEKTGDAEGAFNALLAGILIFEQKLASNPESEIRQKDKVFRETLREDFLRLQEKSGQETLVNEPPEAPPPS